MHPRKIELMRNIQDGRAIWVPDPNNVPQQMAFFCDADVVGFGGAAGGGKTDLAIGKSLMQHCKTLIMRRYGTELTQIKDRFDSLLGFPKYSHMGSVLKLHKRGQQIEFGSAPNLGDEHKYQGRDHDLLVFDEAVNFLMSQVLFLTTWLRSAAGVPTQLLLTFNPPQDADGRWIIDYFGPWLDKKHPWPAAPGELRYFQTDAEGNDIEVPADAPPIYLPGDETPIYPESRTFFPSRVTDNSYLRGTKYMSTLMKLPEPLRSQMLQGDFYAGVQDSEWQVIPTAWVEKAMNRWQAREVKTPLDSMGVDVARGGGDNTVIARRHRDWWFDKLLAYPGTQTPNGPTVAGLVVANWRDRSPVHIEINGVGASPYDFLAQTAMQVIGVNVNEKSEHRDKSGRLKMTNMRTWIWWHMRECLDPENNLGVALPPDKQLLADLTAPLWKLRGPAIYVESREEIIKRIGRSPDYGTAVCLAALETPRVQDLGGDGPTGFGDYNPHDGVGGYDPMASL